MIQLLGLLNEVSSIANSSKGLEKNVLRVYFSCGMAQNKV